MVKDRDDMVSAGVKDIEIPQELKIVDVVFLGGGEDVRAAHNKISQDSWQTERLMLLLFGRRPAPCSSPGDRACSSPGAPACQPPAAWCRPPRCGLTAATSWSGSSDSSSDSSSDCSSDFAWTSDFASDAAGNKSEYLSALEKKLNRFSFWCFDLCQKAVAVNNSVLTQVGHKGLDKLKIPEVELQKTIEGLMKESHSLLESVEEKRKLHNDTVTEVLQEMRALLQERESLKDSQKKKYEEKLKKVEIERDALAEKLMAEIVKGMGKKPQTDDLLNNARLKIKDVESKATSQETATQGCHSHKRKFESQIKAGDVVETTSPLKDSKHSLEKQKEALEQRLLMEAKAELEMLTSQKIAVGKLKNEIGFEKTEIEKKLNEKDSSPSTAKMSAEHVKRSKRTALEDELWAELQGTRVVLKSAQETLAAVQEQKRKIEASLKKILTAELESEFIRLQEETSKFERHIRDLYADIHTELKRKENEQLKALKDRGELITVLKNKQTKEAEQAGELESEFIRIQEESSKIEKHIRDIHADLHAELQRKENEQLKALKDRGELITELKNKQTKQAEQIMDFWSLFH